MGTNFGGHWGAMTWSVGYVTQCSAEMWKGDGYAASYHIKTRGVNSRPTS